MQMRAAWKSTLRVSCAPLVRVGARLVFICGYGALVAWFTWVDVYSGHFSEMGPRVIIYNLARVLFIFYLFWIVHGTGALLLRRIRGWDELSIVDRVPLGFFAGAGVWHLIMLVLGYANLYRRSVAVALTVPIVVASSQYVKHTFASSDAIVERIRMALRRRGLQRRRLLGRSFLFTLAVLSFGSLLMVKGLYPGGGHDYYNHYFAYYRAVIERGGLWPNDVWYHYFYSKGAGLHFLGMLLTDSLAPQLVTFSFVIAAALALFRLLARIAAGTAWPWIGVILFAALYIYTPGPPLNRSHGGWGDFEKLHELTAALFVGVLWMVGHALEPNRRKAPVWSVGAGLTAMAAVIVSPSSVVLLGPVFLGLALWHLVSGSHYGCRVAMYCGAVCACTAVGVLGINYWTTGLINDQGILWFWNFADLEKLDSWGVLGDVMLLHWATTGLVANRVPLTADTLVLVFQSLRLDLLYPLVGAGVILVVLARFTRSHRTLAAPPHGAVLMAALVVCIALTAAVGRSQAISFYRFSSFMMPVTIAIGIYLCAMASSGGGWLRKVIDGFMPAAVLLGCGAAASAQYGHHPLTDGPFRAVNVNAWRFARGLYSIDVAYTTQGGWPGRLPWGGIFPGARRVYNVVGPHSRIRSLHVHSYCMLPDCHMETVTAFTLARRGWDTVMFGKPADAVRTLKEAGLNYFIFARELELHDYLLLNVFSPDNIATHLAIRWTDGRTTLLTWPGRDTTPIDAAWLSAYRSAVEQALTQRNFPYAALRRTYQDLRAKPRPWRPFDLPWHGNRPY